MDNRPNAHDDLPEVDVGGDMEPDATRPRDVRHGYGHPGVVRCLFFQPKVEGVGFPFGIPAGGHPVVCPVPTEADMVLQMSQLWDNMREGEAGDRWEVWVDWMTQDALNDLPEHGGW